MRFHVRHSPESLSLYIDQAEGMHQYVLIYVLTSFQFQYDEECIEVETYRQKQVCSTTRSISM